MKKVLFDEIVDEIDKFCGLTRDCADMLIRKYPMVSRDSLHSIVSFENICKFKKLMHLLYGKRYNYLKQYHEAKERGDPPGIIMRFAAALNLPPALLARVVLERHYKNIHKNVSRPLLSRYLKDTTLIEDADLAYEVYLCILYDDRNGFISDTFCLTIGQEYELKLQMELKERGIAYRTENELRTRGYDKTPDVKLEIPIAIDGFIINWIESKARFGSPQVHETHVKEQFLSYWNRFGPGLVIYWFGFVDEIVEPGEKKFIVMDHFSKNIMYMNPGSLQNLFSKQKL